MLNRLTYVCVCIIVINMILQRNGLFFMAVWSTGRAGGIEAVGCAHREMICSFNWLASFKLG